MSLDWEDVRAFRAVLAAGSLSAAARRLGVAQPTMRRRLDALEAALDTRLFTRTPAGLVPTDAARDLQVHAEAMTRAADALAREASGPAAGTSGTVRLTASDVIGAEVLPRLLVPLRRRHPEIAIEIDLSNRMRDLPRQEADIAVRMERPVQGALVARRVGTIRVGLFAHPDYVARFGAPSDLGDLDRFDLIGPDRRDGDLRLMARAGVPGARSAYAVRVDSHLAQLAAIRAGLGIGICQTALARREPVLTPILPDAFGVGLETWLVMHQDLRRIRRVRLVFDHLAEAIAAYASDRAAC